VGSRAAAQRLIERGAVMVDGEAKQKRHAVKAGETIAIEVPDVPDPADPSAGKGVPFDVVFEDDHLLVVDKPAGVVVHPAPGHPTGTLAQALPAGPTHGGPESSTGWTATRPV
jgi:23S rRNA pseudouridine1911/1915/1917 synthase